MAIACETPIKDLLRDIPEDARLIYEHGPTHSQSIPVGVLARRAAARIHELEVALAEWTSGRASTEPKPWENTIGRCWCQTCRPIRLVDMRMVVCPECGNKRCPRSNNHHHACTGSNEAGQAGSAYPAAAAIGEKK